MLRLWWVVGLVGAYLLVGPGGAPVRAADKDAKPDPEALFKKLDTDKDGKISKDEFKSLFTDPHLALPDKLKADTKLQDELFKKYDTDNDGFISLDEFKALWKDLEKEAAKPDPEALFKKLDTDKDGKISKDEFKSLFTDPHLALPDKLKADTKLQDELFKKYDTDNDGFISLDEFKALWKDLEKQAEKN